MKTPQLCALLLAISSASLVSAQTPLELVSATRVGNSDTIRVRFNQPVAPNGTETALEDDFSGASLDTTRWRVNNASFEGGSVSFDSAVSQTEGEVVINVTGELPPWGGLSLATVNGFTASSLRPLVFEVDRVAHEEDASASRTGIWITDATRSHYVFFAENEGEDGWQYNRSIGQPGDNPTGQGAVTTLVNGDDFNDLDAHRITAVLDGTTVRLYVDHTFATEVAFPFATGIVFEFGAYVADSGDTLTGVFDNARVFNLNAPTQSAFAIDGGATITAVATTPDLNVLELTTTGVTAGGDFTLTVSDVETFEGAVIAAGSTAAINTGTVNATYTAAVLADEPIAYYPMDQIEGSVVPNLGTDGTPATYVSTTGTVLTAGPGLPDLPGFDAGNTAALFDGVGTFTDDDEVVQLQGIGNFIDTGMTYLLDLPAFTIEAWIRPGDLNEFRLGIAGTWGTEFGFNAPDEIHIYTGGGGVIYAPYPYPFHEWHHFVVVGDGTTLTIYADGEVLAQVEEETDNYGGEDRNVYIGGGGIFDDIELDGFGNWFPGGMDEVAIYNKGLTPERVKAHFDAAYAAGLRPTVVITSPEENAAIQPGVDVTVEVDASAIEGRTVSRVEFFDHSVLIGESTSSPFSFTIPAIADGRHTLTAKVYDDLGVSSFSEPVRFTVGDLKPLIVIVVTSPANPTESEEAVRDRIISLDYDAQFVPVSTLSEDDVSEAALVVVPVVGADSVAETLRELPVPILTWDQELQPTFLFTEDEIDVFWGDTGPDLYINIVNSAHPLAAGLFEGVIPVNEFPQEFAWGVPGPEATIIATLADIPERAVIYAYDQGAALVDGSIAPARRVFFMLTDDTFLALNADALSLFDAAVEWAKRVVEAEPEFTTVTLEGGELVLTWTGGGTLQYADDVAGPWNDLAEAASPHPVPIDQNHRFFRIEK